MRSIAEITNASSSEEGDDEDDSDSDGDGDDEDDEDGSEESGEESDEFEDQGSDSDASEEMERQQAEAEVRATQPVPTKCRWKDSGLDDDGICASQGGELSSPRCVQRVFPRPVCMSMLVGSLVV